MLKILKEACFLCLCKEIDDFETIEEYDKFVAKLKSNKDFLLDTFYDNFDGDNEEIISNVEIEE